ncbi:MAG: DUF308 domain-containing protein [Cyanobacteria bacterium J06638_20]
MSTDPNLGQDIRNALSWAIALGILIMLIGLLAILQPYVAAIAATLLVAWFFLLSGVARLIYAIQTRKEGRFIFKLLASLLYFVAGFSLISQPISGSIIIALLVGVAIALKGALQIVFAFQMRPHSGWIWMLLSGFAGIVLGILIWSQGAIASAAILGLLFGLELLFDGLGLTLFAWAGRHALQ